MVPIPKPRILIAPLDWGLGHTTRCIPIINELINAGAEAVIACNLIQETVLRTEFPFIRCIPLTGYAVRYSKFRKGSFFKVFLQIPAIYSRIRMERKWLNALFESEHFDFIISDNRYGLYHKTVPSVFITHQLSIQTPLGFESALLKMHYRFIEKFSCCWIPDYNGPISLAGRLSHPAALPYIPVKYIGALSRLSRLPVETVTSGILIVLSGPEPQREIFEKKIIGQLRKFKEAVVLIRGVPDALSIPFSLPANIRIYNHLPSEALNREMNNAELVIGRSGYSTVMDIMQLGKKAVLVPTPGLPEQEYLARHLSGMGWILSEQQQTFELTKAVEKSRTFSFQSFPLKAGNELSKAIEALLSGIIQ